MELDVRIDRIGESIGVLAGRLAASGFEFGRSHTVFPGPEAGIEGAIGRIERECGALPLALKLFWRRVGSVDFCGSNPNWTGCEYPDPLVIYPPSAAIVELEEFLTDKQERIRTGNPYVVPIAPDFFHKAEVSGGMWYNISVPAIADDPPLNDEWHETTFCQYLELAIRCGGFPGLTRFPGHNWPIAELIRGLPV